MINAAECFYIEWSCENDLTGEKGSSLSILVRKYSSAFPLF
jgi:hypothetical protein